mmetsp:Transcript_23175/g.42728  ORF Transcript_23175/g.42728 Transcript_23175/m.42728 type:complete len:193 (+) Transcript_23175:84-662(+)
MDFLVALLLAFICCFSFRGTLAFTSRSSLIEKGRHVLSTRMPTKIHGITPDGGETDMAAFRQQLIDQMNKEKEQRDEFSGYDLFDLIVDKWGVAYDIRLKKETFAGKPMLFINVLWRYLGQKSFPFKDETEYLEHLQAVAELLVKWERVDHVKEKIAECRKRPQAYFGYAVAIPLNLPVDELITLMPELFDV